MVAHCLLCVSLIFVGIDIEAVGVGSGVVIRGKGSGVVAVGSKDS
jgi:hypothetical protein